MQATKVAITIDPGLLEKIDALVTRGAFANRSKAIQEAIQEKLDRIEHTLLETECCKLDPAFERAMAEEGFAQELSSWPEF